MPILKKISALSEGIRFSVVCYVLVLMSAAIPAYSQAVIATIPTPPSPDTIAVNPVSNKIYVIHNQVAQQSEMTVIDGATNSATSFFVGAPSPGIETLAINTITNKLYASVSGYGVFVIDGSTNVPTQITGQLADGSLAVNQATNKIYVADRDGSITVIDGATNGVTNIAADGPYNVVAVNPVTNTIYFSHYFVGKVTVFDGATNAITATIDNPNGPTDSAVVNQVTNKIYFHNVFNTILVIDGVTNSITTIPTLYGFGILDAGMAVNTITNKIYVASASATTVIDGATNSTITIKNPIDEVGEAPILANPVAVNPVTNKIYVSNKNLNTITIIDGITNATSTVRDPNALETNGVAVNPVTNRIYVTNFFSSNVSVIDGGATTPSCQISSIVAGPPKQLIVTMQDSGSGLRSIQSIESTNSSISIPAFSPGTTSAVLATATKIDQTLGSNVGFQVTNMAGLSTSCDPVDFTLQLSGAAEEHVFRSLTAAEHYVQIVNGTPGVRQMTFLVNGHSFPVPALKDGEKFLLDIGSAAATAMPEAAGSQKARGPAPGRNNKLVLYAAGPRGSSAYVLIGDASVK